MTIFAGAPDSPEIDHDELTQEALRLADLLLGSVEVAQAYLADGEDVPEVLLEDVTQYRLVCHYLESRRDARRSARRVGRSATRAVVAAVNAAERAA